MIKTESLELPGEYRYFSTHVERYLYGAAIVVALIYAVVDQYLAITHCTKAVFYLISTFLIFPQIVLLYTGLLFFITVKRPSHLMLLNYISLVFSFSFHFFFFHASPLAFLIRNTVLFGPLIITQLVVLISFLPKANCPTMNVGSSDKATRHLSRNFYWLMCIGYSGILLLFYAYQLQFMFIIVALFYPVLNATGRDIQSRR